MRSRVLLGVVLGLLAVPAVQGQDVKPAVQGNDGGVHRMEIFNGGRRTVHYFTSSTSPSERQMYRDLERAENEADYVEDLQALRRRYIFGEQRLEVARQGIQSQLYGYSIQRSDSIDYGGYYPGRFGFSPNVFPSGSYYSGFGGYGGYANSSGSVAKSLAIGIAPDGVIKEAMANVLASQATPQYAEGVNRQLGEALSALPNKDGKIGAASFDPNAPGSVTVYLKGDKRVQGQLVREDADWIVVQTKTQEVRVRMSEVVSTSRAIEKK